jgi:hypothetical protein
MDESGCGPAEVYAYTFPSLRELARTKGNDKYPVKVGYSADQDAGAVARIRTQMIEAAGFPERPTLLSIYRTWDGRALESLIHAELRRRRCRMTTAVGAEWFVTDRHEVAEVCGQFGRSLPKPALKPLSGAAPLLSDLVADGARIEWARDSESADVQIRISSCGCDQRTR